LFDAACWELAKYVPRVAVISEITLPMLCKSYHDLLKHKKKFHNILNYPAPSPGTDVTVSTFLWQGRLYRSLVVCKNKQVKLSFQESASGKACYSALQFSTKERVAQKTK